MRYIFTLFSLIALCTLLKAQTNPHTPTWTDGISCIIYSHCSNCHNDQGIAPFSLMSYEDVYANRFSIASSVLARSMPPFPPSQEHVKYAHANTLTDHEMGEILEWIDNFAPFGNLEDEQEPPQFNDQYQLQDPDLVLKIPAYEVNTDNDLYRMFVLPVENEEEKYIESIEIYPGNRDIVHHVLAYKDTSSVPIILDQQDSEPGYTMFGGTGSPYSELFSGYVPGQDAFSYPEGFGSVLQKNSNILLQIHYPGGIYNVVDETEIRLKFSEQPLRNMLMIPALNHGSSLTNGPLFIPANTIKTFYSQTNVPIDVTLTGLFPHMHLIGERIKAMAVTPENDTIHLVEIPKWDFNWQGVYQFQKPILIPGGSTLYGEATYDNTSNNLSNPNNPPKDVRLGEGTDDEMMLIYFNFAPFEPGDTSIIVDTASHWSHDDSCIELTNQAESDSYSTLHIFPNPASEILNIHGLKSECSGEILDQQGRILWSGIKINHGSKIPVNNLASGVYFLHLINRDQSSYYKKIVIE